MTPREDVAAVLLAVRRTALEDAAKIADREWDRVKVGDGDFGGGKMAAAKHIAHAIRSLIPPEKSP